MTFGPALRPPCALLALVMAACSGQIASRGATPSGGVTGGSGASGAAPGPPAPSVDLAFRSGVRRLTSDEYDRTVADLLGDAQAGSALVLPDDPRTPFDNDYTNQESSKTLVEAVELLADDLAKRFIADPARRARVVGCTPTSAANDACVRRFVAAFGRRALRRPLTSDEVDRIATLGAVGAMAGDGWVSIAAVVRALLQHPEFLHRVEIGAPVAGRVDLRRLTSHEVASRLSYLLWGSMPSDALLDRADREDLAASDALDRAATELLTDARARERIRRFHAMWLGYETLRAAPDVAESMRAQTGALIDRVIFDQHRPWQDLFRSSETFVDARLAALYGLPAPAAPTWVAWGSSDRRGLLSEGSFLSVGTKGGDTSPTMRGLAVRRNLFCQPVPDPPPNVNTDAVAPGTADVVCKADRYAAHAQAACKSCHELIDPIGLGLEGYDAAGRKRDHDDGHPECAIAGRGSVKGVGDFEGPAGLADLALSAGLLNPCVVEQWVRFAVGRSHLDDRDEALVQRLSDRAGKGDFRFDALVLDLVTSPAFVHRFDDGGAP